MKRSIIIPGFLAFFLITISRGFAAELLVPSQYSTIQAAINAAVNGDTVIVADGTYTGTGNKNLDFGGKVITVRSENGPANCIIDCQISGRGFYFHNGEVSDRIVSGFTIKRGVINGGSPSMGGGIYCVSSSPTIQNCIIRNNGVSGNYSTSESEPGGDGCGGGIACYSFSSPILIDCIINSNIAGGGNGYDGVGTCTRGGHGIGGGIYSGYNCAPAIINCLIINNITEGGYGGGNAMGMGCNGGDGRGGAIYGEPVLITNCTIVNNLVVGGPGGYSNHGIPPGSNGLAVCGGIYGSETPTISDCIIWGNGDDLYGCSATYSCIEDTDSGTGNIHSDPSFVSGPLGGYYLSQIVSGQTQDSPCVNAGSDTAASLGLDDYTTRTDEFRDKGVVNMGYHYPITAGSTDIQKNWHVDFMDFAALAADWLNHNEINYLVCDINKDEYVDTNDLAVLADCWLDCYVNSANTPNPANNTAGVTVKPVLTWTAGSGTLHHDVYFAVSFADVNNADIGSPVYYGRQDNTTWDSNNYDLAGLVPSTTYYWRIDEIGPLCATKGNVWNFTTLDAPDPNPIGWWKLDETSGTTAYDSAGANNGTVYGPAWTTGQIDGALSFDGVNDYVQVSDAPFDFGASTDFSICVWVKTSALSKGRIIDKQKANNEPYEGFVLWILTSGKAEIYLKDASTAVFCDSTTTIADGNWHFIAAVADRNGNLEIYVDGTREAFKALTVGSIDNNISLAIGRSMDYNGQYFSGLIDDIRIYKKVLSAEEVLQLCQDGFGGKAFNPNPANIAQKVNLNTDLSWSAGKDAVSHDVYFGTTNPPPFQLNQTAATFDPGTMNVNTIYYWRTDEIGPGGTTTGDLWNFTTSPLPGQAANPSPANGASNVSIGADFSWTAGSDTTSHDVYFGTVNPPVFQLNQTATTFDPGTMDVNTTYYWRVDELGPGGMTIGVVWSFTTASITDPNLIGWWTLDEASGTIAHDSSVNSNNGTVNGALWTTGKINGALSFDGVNDYVQVSDVPFDFGAATDFSICVWVKTSALSYGRIIDKQKAGYSPYEGFVLVILASGKAEIYLKDASTIVFCDTTTTIADGDWHFIAAVADRNGNLEIYVDGTREAFKALTVGSIDNNISLAIGRSMDYNGQYFSGLIDDIRIYKKVLSAEEVLQLCQDGFGGKAFNPNPANIAQKVNLNTDLSWSAGKDAVSHDVYFGTTNPPPFQLNQTAATFDPGTMNVNTIYYWRTDEIGPGGTTTGDLWNFTTSPLPGQAANPSPANGASNVSIGADFSWTAGSDTTSHDVYFGSTNPPPFQRNQTATTYDPGTMNINTTYYWRIDELGPGGITPGVVCTFTTEAVDSSFFSWWKFDETSGTIAYDSAGTNNGTVNGALWTTGKINGALSFDGVNDYVQVSDTPFDFGADTDFSICVWVKTSTLSYRRVIDKQKSNHSPYEGFMLVILTSGKAEIYLKDASTTVFCDTTTTVADGNWHFIAAVADRNGNLEIYVDGTREAFKALTVGNINNNISLAIGRSMDYNGQYFSGLIDDVRIYKRVLSASEIQQLYQSAP